MGVDQNYLRLTVGQFALEVRGRGAICLLIVVALASLGLIVWVTTGARMSLLLRLLQNLL